MSVTQKFAILSTLALVAGCSDEYQRQTYYNTEPAHGGHVITSGTYTGPQANPTDLALEASLRDQLNHYGDLAGEAPNVQITARDGNVTLAGAVPSERDRQMIEAMVRNTSGVNSVSDQLRVGYVPTGASSSTVYATPPPPPATASASAPVVTTPAPAPIVSNESSDSMRLRVQGVTDDDRVLAQRIADNLRTDTVLPTLIPDVNISVAGGRVTLRGIVQSDSQRRAIISAVQRVPGVTSVYDELRLR